MVQHAYQQIIHTHLVRYANSFAMQVPKKTTLNGFIAA